VQVNGRAVSVETQEDTGQMVVPVTAGENDVQIKFVRTWDRTIGGLISVLAVLAMAGASRIWRKPSR
ncbi:MAG TPA: hypothetical protein VGK36_21780, partial [Candidatus Angelobacter sp.]